MPWRYGGTPLCRRVDHHEIEPFRIALAVHGGSPLSNSLTMSICACFRQRYTGGTQTLRRRILYVSYRNNKLRG
jgi:hypothetical protein